MLRKILAKIGECLLIGIGIGIVFGAITYVQFLMMTSQFDSGSLDDQGTLFSAYQEFGPDAHVSVTSHRPKPGHERTHFIGEIANEGKTSWSYVKLLVELFDEKNAFIGKCTDNLDGIISPGEKRNFEVSCDNCGDTAVTSYDHYTIRIADASFVRQQQ